MPIDPQPSVLRRAIQKTRHWLYDFFHRARVEAQIDPTHPPHVVFWRFFHFYTKRHRDALIALLLIISLVSSQLLDVVKLYAASYSVSWDSQGDFTSNTASGYATSTTLTGVSASATPGSVVMTQSATSTLTDTFSGTYHLDNANTTAVVSGGALRRSTTDTFTSKTSLISSIEGSAAVSYIVYDSTDNYLFITGGTSSDFTTKYTRLNLANNTATDVSSAFSGVTGLRSFAYDSVKNKIYFIDYWNLNTPKIYSYNPVTNSKTSVTSSGGTGYAMPGSTVVDTDNGYYYWNDDFGSTPAQGKLYRYNTTSGVVDTINIKTSGEYYSTLTYNAGTHKAYLGGWNAGKILVYDPVAGTVSTSTAISNMTYGRGMDNSRDVILAPDPVNGLQYTARFGQYYEPGTFAVYSSTSTTMVDLSSGLATAIGQTNYGWGSGNPVSEYDSYGNASYFSLTDVSQNWHFVKYSPTAGFTDLTSTLSAATGDSTVSVTAVRSLGNGSMYIGTSNGGLYLVNPPASSQTAQSSTLVTASSNIIHATLTASATLGTGTATYYLSNDDGVTWTPTTSGGGVTFASTGAKLKYKVTLTGNASVSSIATAYDTGYTTGTISNMKKDALGDAQWVGISWNATLPANTTLVFKTRGATSVEGAAALYTKSWSDAYTATSTGGGGTIILSNGAGGSSVPTYRYMEVEAILTSSNGIAAPTLNSVSLNYAINAPPEFNTNYPTTSAGGATATQVSDSSDANWGKVKIDYSLRDPDTSAGSVTSGYITPSFSYRLSGSGSFTAIDPTYLSTNATSNKLVSDSSYNTYTAYWNAKGQIPTQYANVAQIKVTANDNELIYNLAYATTSAMTIDTTAPTHTLFEINGSSSTSTIRIAASDDTTIKDYMLSNNADYSADGSNASSGSWQAVGANTLTLNQAWTLNATSTTSTVYVAIRDIYGNVASSSIVAPVAPSSFEIHDISNVAANTYKLFVAWTPYSNASGATFSSYRLLRSADGSNYSLYQTITDSNLNYYLDNSIASSTTYYYKLQTVDTNGDTSNYTDVVSAQPSGQGGSSLPPIISNVVVGDIKNTSARVTWDTNTLTNSVVNYGTTNSYGSTASGSSYVSSHTLYLNNLTANTTYYVKVGSTDFYTNTTNDDNGGASYTFTTGSGTVISNVTTNSITDTSADVFWNTSTPSDSYVSYSTNADLSSPVLAGNGTLVSTTSSSGVYSHQVHLSGLSVSSTYYYKVQSTDANANLTVADNNGSYYSFLTTRDVTPPVISSISVPVITKTSAVIVWSTDKRATSQVEYGTTASTTSGTYTTTTDLNSTLTPTHVITIEGLTANTPYYFRVKSNDAAGNSATSNEQTFTTADTDAAVVSVTVSLPGSGGTTRSTTPPTISNITVGPINAFDATVQVTGSPAFLANVQYGEVSSSSPSGVYSLFGSGEPTKYETSKSIKLTGLTPGTKYHFIASVVDIDGNMQKSSEQTFTTKYLAEDLGNLSALDKTTNLLNKLQDILESALPSISPPSIANPQVTDITEQTATVTWTTNIKAYGLVDYSNEKDYATSTYASEVSDLDATSKDHSIKLINLMPATKYHYSARSFVFPQVVGKSPDLTFTTKAGAITPQILDVKTDSFRVIWTTQNLTNSIIDYTDRKTGRTYTQKDASYTTKHDVSAENLVSGDTYDVKAYGYDKDGTLVSMAGTVSVTPALDTVPPNVTSLRIDSNLVPGRTDIIQSLVSWKTDKPSTSVVTYEEGSGAADQPLKNKVQNDTGFVKDHVVILPSLKPSTIYRIQVSSTDQAGNTLTLPIRTIVTPQQTESIIDIIFKNFSDTFNFVGK